MGILCSLFGHRAVRSFNDQARMGGGEYATDVRGPYVDGVGRQHFTLIVACPRCGERYVGCKIHANWVTNLLENTNG